MTENYCGCLMHFISGRDGDGAVGIAARGEGHGRCRFRLQFCGAMG